MIQNFKIETCNKYRRKVTVSKILKEIMNASMHHKLYVYYYIYFDTDIRIFFSKILYTVTLFECERTPNFLKIL